MNCPLTTVGTVDVYGTLPLVTVMVDRGPGVGTFTMTIEVFWPFILVFEVVVKALLPDVVVMVCNVAIGMLTITIEVLEPLILVFLVEE